MGYAEYSYIQICSSRNKERNWLVLLGEEQKKCASSALPLAGVTGMLPKLDAACGNPELTSPTHFLLKRQKVRWHFLVYGVLFSVSFSPRVPLAFYMKA